MKAFITCLIVSIFVLSGLGADAISTRQPTQTICESMSFSWPMITETTSYTVVDLEEATSCLLETGKPILPVVTKVYTFPRGTQIQDVQVSFSEPKTQVISKPVMPAKAPQYLSVDLAMTQSSETEMNAEVYQSERMYPETLWNYHLGAGLDGQNHVLFLSVHYCPVSYIPAQNILSIHDQSSIEISYTLPSTPKVFGDTYNLLILTPAEFSTALQPLVEFKNGQGIPTKLTTLEEIPHVGYDVQEDIKYYIKDAIENWGITYVLLVGSGLNGAEKFPVRYAWVPSEGYEDSFPSDLYYADIYNILDQFSSWDFNGNHKYGEFPNDILAVDLHPDVYLTRLPCIDASEVKTVVRKIMNFIQNNKQKGTILQIGGDSFIDGDDEHINEGEFANVKVMEKLPGYQTTQLWGSNGQLTKLNIILGIYKGVDYVDFNGHGSPISWATHPPQDESTWIPTGKQWSGFTYVEVYWLFNFYKLPIVFINACSTNKFSESETCLGWSFLKKQIGGGIAAFGASGIGYGMIGSSEVDRLFGWMEVQTFDNMHTLQVIGDAWGASINDYVNEFGWMMWDADYKTCMEFSLFADPSLPVYPSS